jgi:hypothetical protein
MACRDDVWLAAAARERVGLGAAVLPDQTAEVAHPVTGQEEPEGALPEEQIIFRMAHYG